MTDVVLAEWLSKSFASPREMKIAARHGRHLVFEDSGVCVRAILFDGHLYVDRVSFPEEERPDQRRGEYDL